MTLSVMPPLVVEKYPRPHLTDRVLHSNIPGGDALGPVSLAGGRKPTLHLKQRVAEDELRRNRHEHVDVPARQLPAQDVGLVLAAPKWTYLIRKFSGSATMEPGWFHARFRVRCLSNNVGSVANFCGLSFAG